MSKENLELDTIYKALLALEIDGYQKGLSKAWDLARTISTMSIKNQFEIFNKGGVANVFGCYTAEKALEKLKAWEEENDCYEKIKNLSSGTTIELGGIKMEILYPAYPAAEVHTFGVFCLAKDILFEKQFDEGNNNNWENSSLRKYLNGEYKESLDEELAGALIPFKRNLLTDDGMKDYGTCVDMISLISEREYQDYREYISNKSGWWWTLTAWSAEPSNSNYARYVYTDGSLDNYNADNGNNGIVPVFLLKPLIKVKVVKEEE